MLAKLGDNLKQNFLIKSKNSKVRLYPLKTFCQIQPRFSEIYKTSKILAKTNSLTTSHSKMPY